MATKSLLFSNEAKVALARGAFKLGKAVTCTAGPGGNTVLIEKKYGGPRLTKDGVSVAKEVELSDKFENEGAKFVRTAAVLVNSQAGDGTTAAIGLASNMIQKAIQTAPFSNHVRMSKGIEKGMEAVKNELKKNSKKVVSKEDMSHVATISANNDPELGNLIADVIMKVGSEAPVAVEEGSTTEVVTEVVEGMQLDRGYTSHYFVTDTDKMICELEDCFVLLMDYKLSSVAPIVTILEHVSKLGKSLLVCADDVEGEAQSALIFNKLKGSIKVCPIKAPAFGERKQAMLQDMAILTGGTVISEEKGDDVNEIAVENLGKVDRAVITKDATTLVGGHGKKKEIEARCKQIDAQIKSSTSEYDIEKLKERKAKLSGGVAVIKVGGFTEIAIKEKKDRVEDAVNATKAAIETGIVPGGGCALLHASKALDKLKYDNEDERIAFALIKAGCKAPFHAIVENAGFKEESGAMLTKVMSDKNVSNGYDARTGEYVDMFKAGIIDPLKSPFQAVEVGCGLLMNFLTIGCVMTEDEEKNPETPGKMTKGIY